MLYNYDITLQLIKLTPWNNVGIWALLKGPTAVATLGLEPGCNL